MKKKKVVKIKFKRIFLFLLVIFCFGVGIYNFLNLKITNIYIGGEEILSEEEVIEIALIKDYPKTFSNFSTTLKKRLEQNIYIKEAFVSKDNFTEVVIEIVENKPLFYYKYDDVTVLSDGQVVEEKFVVPTVLNYVIDEKYNDLISCLDNLDDGILSRISEIEYKPNEVDDELFLLSMTDGNYVYVNISTFDKLNRYVSIMTNLPQEKGILYLDYGNNFEILE